MQHHDAITGTEKTMVERDYHKRVTRGMESAISGISNSLSYVIPITNLSDITINFDVPFQLDTRFDGRFEPQVMPVV